MKGYGWHEGDRSEHLALFAFSTIGFCASVPRQNDHFVVDFFVHLARWEDKTLVPTGRAVCAQVKSDANPVLLEKPDHLKCLLEPAVPFFYVVIDKQGHSIRVYTMVDRLNAFWSGWTGRVWVVPGEGAAVGHLAKAKDGDKFLYLGKPVYEKQLAVLEDDATKKTERALFLNVIEAWATWEQIHLGSKEARFPLYARYKDYKTNEAPSPDALEVQHLYYPTPSFLDAYCRGVRLHIDVLKAIVGDVEAAGADAGIPDFPAWAGAVKTSIDTFLKASTLPDPPKT